MPVTDDCVAVIEAEDEADDQVQAVRAPNGFFTLITDDGKIEHFYGEGL
jgi:hypothetical protein